VNSSTTRSRARNALRLGAAVGLCFTGVLVTLAIAGSSAGAVIPPPEATHVYAQGTNGHLYEYVPDNQNGNIWNAYDLTAAAGGGAAVTGTPATAVDNNLLVHVFVAGPGGHLYEYVPDHQNGNIWNAYDLTAAAGGGAPVTGNPSVAFDLNLFSVRVYVPGTAGHLTEYVPDHQNGNIWNAYDLTADAGGGAPVTGNPSAVADFLHRVIRIYVPGPGGHLIEYVPDNQNGKIWNAYDVSAAAGGGAPVTGTPNAVQDFATALIRVYVPGPAGHLTEYLPDHQSGNIWNAYDLTNAAGGGLPITGSPSVIFDFHSRLIRVYVVDPGHLAEYLPDHQNGNIWNAYDLTAHAGGGAPVTGSPAATNGINFGALG
jgi:hypothetical protein